MLILLNLVKFLQNNKSLFLFMNDFLVYIIKLVFGEFRFQLLLSHSKAHLRKLVSRVLHNVRQKTFTGYSSKLISDVDSNHTLTQHLKVEFPPAEVYQRKETITKFKDKSFNDE